MAVSRMMAACTLQLVEQRRSRNPLYAALNEAMQRATVTYTFSDRITTGQERAMSHRAVPQFAALRPLGKVALRELVDAHFDGVTGLEHAKNEFMPKFNQRILDRACLTPDEKRTWFELLNSLQRNLQFFPAGYAPGTGVAEAFDDEAQTGA
jgi:tRNA C32,U32 (ribose-2'-O)-methylase TrmJ